jgi:hypothetical protein
MNDDELRRELERRSKAASFRAEELLPEVRRWTDGGFTRPSRFQAALRRYLKRD